MGALELANEASTILIWPCMPGALVGPAPVQPVYGAVQREINLAGAGDPGGEHLQDGKVH